MRSILPYRSRPGCPHHGRPGDGNCQQNALFHACFGRAAAAVTASVILALVVTIVDPISVRASILDQAQVERAAENAAVDADEQEAPVQMIERFHAELLTVMQNAERWDYRARRDRLAPIVVEMFDSGSMTRIASGRHWKTFDDAQKATLTGAFRAFTLANYAARFNGYSGQKFETTGETRRDEKRTFVRTALAQPDGEVIRIDYLMHKVGKTWRIIDVFVEGRFSELAVRRSEFAPLLRDQGFPGLVEVLRNKVSELEAEEGAD